MKSQAEETSLDASPSKALQVRHSRWWSTAHHGMGSQLLDTKIAVWQFLQPRPHTCLPWLLDDLNSGSSIPSRYLRTTLPNILGWKCSVSPLSAIGRRKSFRLKALASSVFRCPPGVCLWSPHQIMRHLRGAFAIAEASSRFP